MIFYGIGTKIFFMKWVGTEVSVRPLHRRSFLRKVFIQIIVRIKTVFMAL